MWSGHGKRVCQCVLSRIDVRIEIGVGRDVPNDILVVIIHTENAEQGKASLQLKHKEIAGLKSLRHTGEISITKSRAIKLKK